MELLREIYERDLGISDRDVGSRRHGTRVWFKRIACGVIFNARHEIALLHIEDGDYYKLPGGELEAPDSMEEALLRGIFGELGASVTIVDEIGLVMEYRDEHELLQFSYGFIAKLSGETPSFEGSSDELPLLWMKPKDAVALLHRHKADSYSGKFNQERDICFLKQIESEGADER